MKILDLSAGNRAIWFDKNNKDVVFVDIRPEVNPTIIADSKSLPFADSHFNMVVFDPPHVNFGKNANMSRNYGYHTTSAIRELITTIAIEAYRVTKPSATMSFKWNSHDQKLSNVLNLMPQWIPLFGHIVSIRTKHTSTTSWVLLRKA